MHTRSSASSSSTAGGDRCGGGVQLRTFDQGSPATAQLAVLLAVEIMVPRTEICTLVQWCAVDRAWRASVSVALQRVGVAIVHIQHSCAELGVAEWDSDWGEQIQIFDTWRSWLSPLLQRPQRKDSSSAVRFARLRSDRQSRAARDVAGWVAGLLSPQVGQPQRPVLVVAAAEARLAELAARALRSDGAPVCMVTKKSLASVLAALGRACNPPVNLDEDSGWEDGAESAQVSAADCLCGGAGRPADKPRRDNIGGSFCALQ